jgi:hypothetical protein
MMYHSSLYHSFNNINNLENNNKRYGEHELERKPGTYSKHHIAELAELAGGTLRAVPRGER